ncbi:hypothetical protein Peur_055111 [Populus x canadensis]
MSCQRLQVSIRFMTLNGLLKRGLLARLLLTFWRMLPSVTTNEINKAVCQMIIDAGDAGAYPSPLGNGGFQNRLCTSVNECTCHGIPVSYRFLIHHFILNEELKCKFLVHHFIIN